MSVTRRIANRRTIAHAALMASASFLSLTFASEAQAQCVTNNTDPVSNVTTDGTIVTCTGAVVSQTVQATANQVDVEISGGATVSGGSNIFVIGDQNEVYVRSGGSLIASTVYTLGANSGVVVQGNVDAAGITVDGAGSGLFLDTNGIINIAPGNLSVFGAVNASNNITLRGTLSGSSSTGSYLLRGGNGQQRVFLSGTINVQADGLAMDLGNDNDEIYLQAGAVLTGGTNNNILIDGGAGNDRLEIDDSGLSHFSTIGIETLVLDPGTGGFRGLSGSHADVTRFVAASGTVNVTNLAALGQTNSNVLIVAGSHLRLSQVGGGAFDHVLAGEGMLSLNSAGSAYTFGGSGSTFSGDLLIGSGNTAIIVNEDALGTATFINDGTVQFGGGVTLDNAITGTGIVVKNGGGQSTLSGTNSYSGGTFVQSGQLNAANGSALGTGGVSISAGANLNLDFLADGTLANDLSGGGALFKSGSSTVTLTGNNSYSGGTTIAAGALRIDDFARLGTGATQADAGASLILNYNGAGQLLQTTPFLTGSGTFIKEGSGDVVIDVANTYTGGTTIRAGRLGLNNGDALGTGAIQIDAGAELGVGGIILNNDLTGSGLVRKTANNTVELNGNNLGFTGTIQVADGDLLVTSGNALGSGTLQIDAGTAAIVNALADSTVVADLTGDGVFTKAGAAKVTLTGNGAQFGGTVAIQDGTLQIAGDQNVGTSPGGIFINVQGTLQLDTAGTTNLATVVYGSGNVVKTGSGTVFMTGANNYSGGTDIQQGAIRVTDVSVLGTGPISVQAGAALDLFIANTQSLNQSVTGAGILRKSGAGDLTLLGNGLSGGVDITGGRLFVGSAAVLGGGPVTTAVDTQLVFDTAGTETISNLISGAGGLTKNGSGVLVIQNANTYTGGTIINAGRLGLNNGQGLGTGDVLILQGAQLSLGGVSVANTIGGAGQVVKTANNAGFLTGTNTYSGGTDIQQGQLVVATPASLGTGGVQIANGAALVVDYSGANAVTLGNVLTGGGSLIKDGNGALVVLGTGNNYVGGTAVSGGSLVVGNAGALGSGDVAVSNGAVVEIGAITFANNVLGAGRIVKTGSGAGALTGTNTHSGGVEIQGGSLAVSGNGALGSGGVSIAAGANLAYTNAGAATFSNGLSGAGTFTKLGAGQLTFAGNFTLGALNLSAGRTRINTVATTNATVASGATLDGTGRIIGNLVNNGTVAPGNSIGTLTVQGNYTHNAGSVLEVEFDANGNIDLLDVTGNAVLNGGTIRFVGIGGAEGQGGTFLRTGGSVTGTFGTIETVGALLPLSVFYTANTGQMAPSVVTARPSTFNAQNLAAADTTLGYIESLGLVDARHGRGSRLWMSGFGAWGNRSASGTTLAYDHETRGVSGGINLDVGDGFTIGFAGGWADGDITLGSNGGGGEQTTTLGSAGLRYQAGDIAIGMGLVFGNVDQATVRNVSFNGFNGSVEGATESSLFALFAEASAWLGASGGWNFEAHARGTVVRQEQDGYTESGVSPLRLKLDALATETLEGQARMSATRRLWDGSGGAEETAAGLDLRLDLGGRYLALHGDRPIPVVFAVSNAGIVLQGDTRDTVQGIGGIALDYTTRGGARISLGYRAEIGKTDRHAAQASVSFPF